MKRLPIVLCLMLLGIVLLNSHVYAAYIYEVDSFKQYNGTNTFEDNFNDGTAPPIGPDGSSTDYNVDSSGPLSESGGVLVLDGGSGGWIGVELHNPDYYFTDGSGGSVEAVFNYDSSNLQYDSLFLIQIFNMASDGTWAVNGDEAIIAVSTSSTGSVYAAWGDENASASSIDGTELFTGSAFTNIKLSLDISATNWVSGSWEFFNGSSSVFQYTETNFTSLGFGASSGSGSDLYTGVIGTEEPGVTVEPVPEPTTIALLGIGLVGLAGAELRRRRKIKQ